MTELRIAVKAVVASPRQLFREITPIYNKINQIINMKQCPGDFPPYLFEKYALLVSHTYQSPPSPLQPRYI